MCQCEGTSPEFATCCFERAGTTNDAYLRVTEKIKAITDRTTPREDLDAKLDVFDRYAHEAVDELVAWLTDHAEDLIALARGRHIDGHYRYGDGNFLEYDDGRLRAETAEEIADAIVYRSRQIKRRVEGGR